MWEKRIIGMFLFNANDFSFDLFLHASLREQDFCSSKMYRFYGNL